MATAGTAGRNPVELATGAAVLAVAAGFLLYAVTNNGAPGGSGYRLHAAFDHIDGLAVGADVRMAGVKVGSVLATSIDPRSFLADVTMSVRDDLHLPTDTSAEVTSDGLLGGKYLALSPGGADKVLPSGGTITVTQGSVSLEQLLGKFIFSVTDMVNAVKPGAAKPDAGASGTAPANAPASAPASALGGSTR